LEQNLTESSGAEPGGGRGIRAPRQAGAGPARGSGLRGPGLAIFGFQRTWKRLAHSEAHAQGHPQSLSQRGSEGQNWGPPGQGTGAVVQSLASRVKKM
jgi:hypothetical protein